MFEPGDLIACYGRDPLSWVIEWGTGSLVAPRGLRRSPSHVAIICAAPEVDPDPVWVESTTLCDRTCLIRKAAVSGVQVHHPAERIEDYLRSGGRVDVYRLTDINRFGKGESQLLSKILLDYFVRPALPYDYAGAALSGTRVFQWTRWFPAADLQSLFCSELVAAVLMRLNRLNHDNPTRFHPGRLLRELVRTGKYRRVAG